MTRILICTVDGVDPRDGKEFTHDCCGTEMEYYAVRMKKGDNVRYSMKDASGKIQKGTGKFVCSSFMTGEPHFEIDAADGSRVTVFTGCGDTIENV